MEKINAQEWKKDLPLFEEKIKAFNNGEVSKNDYKGFSGLYGSYAQRDPKANMLRLRMTAGVVTKEKLKFVADTIQKYNVNKAHFTTCEAIQLHNLPYEDVPKIMEEALDVDIVTMGGGGDFPRNVMCSPLSGVDPDEYFDVAPYAKAAAEFLMGYIKAPKMPRKLKVCFSSSPKNVPHATYRDLGFVARSDGKFDVYSAGGLGNNPKFGVLMAEAIDPSEICYYIRAMYKTFVAYGNYQNRGKARTRYMQEICGGPEAYREKYLEKLAEVFEEGNDLHVYPEAKVITKAGDGEIEGRRIFKQKQDGLYAVAYHPIGGVPDLNTLVALARAVEAMEDVEMRLQPDEGTYIVNLTASEAKQILDITESDSAQSEFETSVACIGATICQVGLRDSQGLLHECVTAIREAGIKDGCLPQIHISGCPSSCGTHQTGIIGFRGFTKKVDGKPAPGFTLFAGGNDQQGKETMGQELGVIAQSRIPEFLIELGKAVENSGKTFMEWYSLEAVQKIAEPYVK